jgi:hypothetical protein
MTTATIAELQVMDPAEVAFFGYRFKLVHGKLHCIEADSRAWKMMQEFTARYPRGDECQWDAFLVRHAAQQDRDFAKALAAYRA